MSSKKGNIKVDFQSGTVMFDGAEFRLGVLQYVLAMAMHRFSSPTGDRGQWAMPPVRPEVFGEAFPIAAKLGLLSKKCMVGVGEVYKITPAGIRAHEKLFPKERWHQRLLRFITGWLWYKPRFYMKYGVWP